ncbi:hypothetical protein Tco_1427019 [Tanacetum coccineum]
MFVGLDPTTLQDARRGHFTEETRWTCVHEFLVLGAKESLYENAINEFSKVSGLVPNLDKSVTFFGNVPSHTKRDILRVMAFTKGSLPIRYLGVPLISFILYKKFCDPLIDKVKQRLINWKNKVLSFARRLQLIQSVLSSIQVLWSSVFILPVSVSLDIE